MNKKKNVIIPLCISFSIIYIILSARPLAKELHIVPQWTIDVSRPLTAKAASAVDEEAFANAIPFKLAQTLGYFTEDGTVLIDTTFDYKATIAKRYYATYNTHSMPITVYTSNGNVAAKIEQTGFPYFTDDGLYLFLPGGSSFAQLGEDGALLWKYESYAPITAFGTAPFGCITGFADGTVVSFDKNGNLDQQFEPAGSDYPIILGVALSASGEMLACVSGQEKQRFVLAHRLNAHTEIIYHEYLTNEVTRQLPVVFSRDERYVYYNDANGLGIVDTAARKGSHIALNGKILSMKEAEDSATMFVLSRDGDTYTVSIVEPFDTHAGSFSFTASNAFIAVKGNALFVGRDGTISRMNIVQK